MRDVREAYEERLEKDIETLKSQNYQLRLSLRDHFAAAALTGLTGNQEWLTTMKKGFPNRDAAELAALAAYEAADAMLEAREAKHDSL